MEFSFRLRRCMSCKVLKWDQLRRSLEAYPHLHPRTPETIPLHVAASVCVVIVRDGSAIVHSPATSSSGEVERWRGGER
jgi:hypothetical protein